MPGHLPAICWASATQLSCQARARRFPGICRAAWAAGHLPAICWAEMSAFIDRTRAEPARRGSAVLVSAWDPCALRARLLIDGQLMRRVGESAVDSVASPDARPRAADAAGVGGLGLGAARAHAEAQAGEGSGATAALLIHGGSAIGSMPSARPRSTTTSAGDRAGLNSHGKKWPTSRFSVATCRRRPMLLVRQ